MILGLKFTTTLITWLGARVTVDPPPALNPAPDAVTAEIVTLVFPVFVTVTICVVVDPTVTLPKLRFGGLAES